MLTSLTTTAQTAAIDAKVAAVYEYLAANIEPHSVSVGADVPAAEDMQ
jgi:hypothetical protein